MPLMKGHSKGVIGENIRELMKSGKKQDQAIAIAMKHAGKSKKPATTKKKPDYRPDVVDDHEFEE
jgi:hypothetical protein